MLVCIFLDSSNPSSMANVANIPLKVVGFRQPVGLLQVGSGSNLLQWLFHGHISLQYFLDSSNHITIAKASL
jgi:hypothetical protein